jgi:branched-chain amino acid transport system permease protein
VSLRERLPAFVRKDGKRKLRLSGRLVLSPAQAIGGLLLAVLLLALPDISRLSDSLQLSVFHQGVLFGIAAVGLNLLLRHTKLVSFGHAAFFGGGAYTAAVLASNFGVNSFLVLLIAAVAVSTVLAAVIGALSLRHTGLYFSLLTLAFGMLLFSIIEGNDAFFGGTDGLPIRPEPAGRPLLFGAEFGPNVYGILLYYITLIVLLIALVVMWRLINSPFGKALDAIGQDRTRARFIGIPVERYIWMAFVISGVYGGLAGALYAMLQLQIDPNGTLFFLRSGDILFMAILGGFQTLVGPIVGGIVLIFVQDVGQDFTIYFNAVTGFALLLLVFGFPRGIVGTITNSIGLLDRVRGGEPGSGEPGEAD